MVLLDQNDREKALDVQCSCIVQAPAGSGKTTLLTKRFLNLLAYAVDSPEEILALTFTKKAAGEMKARILATLNDNQDKLVQKVLEKSKIKKWALNDNPNRLKIMTIDSHCASLVKQMPLLSRLGAHHNISQFPEMLYQQASENLLNDLRNKTSYQRQLEIVLMHCDNEPNKVVRLFA